MTALTRAGGKQVYRIAFSFRGAQCRELVALPHSKSNAAYCERLRHEIMGQIERGTFDYSAYFPASPRAALFGHGKANVPKLRTLLEAYRDRVRHTFASNLLSQGENPALISRLLGHKTVAMVIKHYGRWIGEGEALGFDRPQRTFGMRRLWAQEKTG